MDHLWGEGLQRYGMEKTKRKSPTEMPLPFQLDGEPAREMLTGFAGAPLLIQAFRSLGGPAAVSEHVQVKQRDRGYDEATLVESFLLLNAMGGECLDDFERLRADEGLAELIGHGIPSPEAARKFLYEFHDEQKMEAAEQQRQAGQAAVIPQESAPLEGLSEVNKALIGEIGERCRNQKIATVDLDATIIESHKREALRTYEGERGYQPMLAVWAETELILADEFRDGNVPPMYAPLTIAQRAFAALPATANEFYFRGDSACYERKLMRWLNDPEREAGPKGFIGFAISVRIHPQLRTILEQIPDTEWKPAPAAQDPNETREYSEVPFEPGQPYEGKNQQSLRYLGIRIRRHQGQLFDGTPEVKHFAVVTNMPLPAAKLIPWHREKAGSIERIHDVLKNELAAGVLPCGRFGANAAWFRLAVISHNIITALKRIALPAKYLAARPKRMRFLFFHLPGRLVQHARAMWLRVASLAELIGEMQEAFQALPLRS
jgi:hypothetical protein